MAVAVEISGNQPNDESHVIEAPEAATINSRGHGHDVYELQVLDVVQPEPQKTRSRLRLLAILIALDVSSGCTLFISY